MNTTTSINKRGTNSMTRQLFKTLAILIVLVGGLFAGMLAMLWLSQTPSGAAVVAPLQSLFAMDTVQAWWYITRAAGLTGYFLLWLSMVWGMAISTKFFHPAVEGTFSYDFHEYLSLLGLGFIVLHITVLMLDQFLRFSIWQVMIPFIDTYRPFWTGLGIIGFYIFLLVTVTFYMRKTIGTQAFRSIHVLSLVGYLGATAHGLFAGTDSALAVTKVLYGGTFLIVLFLTIYWVTMNSLNKYEKAKAAQNAARNQRLRTYRR